MSISSLKPISKYGIDQVIRGKGYEAKVKYSSLNERIVVKEYSGGNLINLGKRLKGEASRKDYGKIWAKIRAKDHKKFMDVGFEVEAVIKDFYIDEDAMLMAFYPDKKRGQIISEEEDEIIKDIEKLETLLPQVKPENNCKFKLADSSDAEDISELYEEVFTSYPTPIFDAEYIGETIEEGMIYGLIYEDDQLVAAASAETNSEYKNAEMTDFATLPSKRGNGYASYILEELEEELKARNYHTLYSIARAISYGMNKVFKVAGYEYTGRLIQNCHIAGDFEDMNLWCKVIE